MTSFHARRPVKAALICIVFVYMVAGQATQVDNTYQGVPSLPLLPTDGTATTIRQAIQADGKVLVWGAALTADGKAKGRIVRLDADGRLDTTFTYCHCELTSVTAVLALPDGRILVSGTSVNGWRVIRLNSDGSLDPSFLFAPTNTATNTSATLVALQVDGKFLVTRFFSFQGFSGLDLYRFNADGSQDTTYTGVSIGSGSPNFSTLGAIEVLPDGSSYIAINTFGPFSTFGVLRRHTTTGAVDPTWEVPNFGPNPSITGLDTDSEGRLLVTGNFDVVNGTPKVDLVRLMPPGNVDLNFTGPAGQNGTGVRVVSGGKILFSSDGAVGGGNRIMRLTSNGSIDPTFTMDPSVPTIRNHWVVDSAERIIFAGDQQLLRLQQGGAIDPSFMPNMGQFGRVHTLAMQSDGKVIVAGAFTAFNGVATIPLVRTNPDGTRDPSFAAGTGFDAIPTRMIVQTDDRILVLGPFNSYNGAQVSGIVRLMPDGVMDTTFNVNLNSGSQVFAADLLPNGSYYLAGSFSTVNGVSRPGVVRLNPNGSVDTAFNALIGGSPSITAVVAQPDGKVLIGGSFSGIGGFNRSGFARVDETGALDQTFNPSNTTAGRIYLTTSGKILTTSASSIDSLTVIRRNPDGTTDTSFNSVTFTHTFSSGTARIDAILPGADGTVIVAGYFNRVGGLARSGIVRLAPNGTVDSLFLPGSSDNRVRTVVSGSKGKILIGGDFTQVENQPKAGLARINVSPFRKTTLFDFDGDGRADFTVFRPSENTWYVLQTSDWQYRAILFGASGDIIAPGDFDGDGKTDPAIFRPSTGDWWYAASSLGGAHRTVQHGLPGDIPRPADFDGDGKTDFVVFRPSNSTWYKKDSLGNVSAIVFGTTGDIPVQGDFDGDGRYDYSVFRPSTGTFWYAASGSGNQFRAAQWGQNGDVPVPSDYDGDGRTDVAIYRPDEGGWYIWKSATGTIVTMAFGLSSDRPIPADYDGDGSVDIAIFRPSTGVWYLYQSSAGSGGVQWGVATDLPATGAFTP